MLEKHQRDKNKQPELDSIANTNYANTFSFTNNSINATSANNISHFDEGQILSKHSYSKFKDIYVDLKHKDYQNYFSVQYIETKKYDTAMLQTENLNQLQKKQLQKQNNPFLQNSVSNKENETYKKVYENKDLAENNNRDNVHFDNSKKSLNNSLFIIEEENQEEFRRNQENKTQQKMGLEARTHVKSEDEINHHLRSNNIMNLSTIPCQKGMESPLSQDFSQIFIHQWKEKQLEESKEPNSIRNNSNYQITNIILNQKQDNGKYNQQKQYFEDNIIKDKQNESSIDRVQQEYLTIENENRKQSNTELEEIAKKYFNQKTDQKNGNNEIKYFSLGEKKYSEQSKSIIYHALKVKPAKVYYRCEFRELQPILHQLKEKYQIDVCIQEDSGLFDELNQPLKKGITLVSNKYQSK